MLHVLCTRPGHRCILLTSTTIHVAVAQWLEHQNVNQKPGLNHVLLCQTFGKFGQSILLQFIQLSSHQFIQNEWLAIDSGGYLSKNSSCAFNCSIDDCLQEKLR